MTDVGRPASQEEIRASEEIPVIKQDIVHNVVERTGLPRTKAEAAVDTVFEGLKQALAAGARVWGIQRPRAQDRHRPEPKNGN